MECDWRSSEWWGKLLRYLRFSSPLLLVMEFLNWLMIWIWFLRSIYSYYFYGWSWDDNSAAAFFFHVCRSFLPVETPAFLYLFSLSICTGNNICLPVLFLIYSRFDRYYSTDDTDLKVSSDSYWLEKPTRPTASALMSSAESCSSRWIFSFSWSSMASRYSFRICFIFWFTYLFISECLLFTSYICRLAEEARTSPWLDVASESLCASSRLTTC